MAVTLVMAPHDSRAHEGKAADTIVAARQKTDQAQEQQVLEHDERAQFKAVPEGESDAYRERLVAKLCTILDLSRSQNVNMPPADSLESMFYSVTKQAFSLEFYIRRVVLYLPDCSASVFVAAVYYLAKLQAANPMLALNEMNIHRLFLTAVVVATKFAEDLGYSNGYVAKVGGIQSVKEMNRMEVVFLKFLEYNCFIEPEVYDEFAKLVF
ncbi:Cyclin-U4-1 [Porphyridium purpureum]|uniref:Cyclin-U4-1 n=1 Tax=Porphyridium purpureum TaxID=35688 RepID=A0A5J4YX72_PORPP|nr:Cyclin-U4-1 [Porphyridium purpureum]|eukprot:POR2591..scf209_3